MAITIGATAVDRPVGFGSGSTLIEPANPAHAAGLVTQIQIYASQVMSGIQVATFKNEGGNTFSTHDYCSLANAAVGLNTYNSPADFVPIEVATDEYIGIYFSGGVIDMTENLTLWALNGDHIPCASVDFGGVGTQTISLGAIGYQLGSINIGDNWKVIQNIKVNVGDSWKTVSRAQINIGDVWKTIF